MRTVGYIAVVAGNQLLAGMADDGRCVHQTIHALAQEFLKAGMAPPAPADYSSGAAVPKEQIEAAATAVEQERRRKKG